MRNWAEVKVRLTLIRHGAAKSNMLHRYLGKKDEALSEEGIRGLLEKKEKGIYETPKSLFAGSMLRCRQTAEILFPNKKYECIPEWTEIDFGTFEGKNYKELSRDELYKKWIDSNGTMPFPNGEDREDFIKRSMKGFWRMLSFFEIKHEGKEKADTEITAVVNGGTIMAVLCSLSGGGYFDYQTGCGEGYICCFYLENKNIYLQEIKKLC